MEQLKLLGISHQTAPVEIREKVFIPDKLLASKLAEVKALPGVNECLIISTCNRTEIYYIGPKTNIFPLELKPYLYELSGEQVIDQAMKVASGLDSMIIGEGQVLKQFKDAFSAAQSNGFTGSLLNALFNRAISAGKRVRTETAISRGAVSVSASAVQLARNIFADLSKHQIMIIGAGKMSELAAKQLICYGVKSTLVSNRTFAKAEELARQFGGRAVRFDELEQYLVEVDIVISSTGAPHFLLRDCAVRQIMKRRQGRPLFFIDIAVPRDIDPLVATIDDVFLYDIDDLGRLAEANRKEREKEIPKVMEIISQEKARLLKWALARPTVLVRETAL